MAKQVDHDREAEVRTAINRVLNAERDAERSIVECRLKAEQILEAARKRARHTARRAERRVNAIHRRCIEAADARVKALEAEASGLQACEIIDEHDKNSFRSAIERVAAWLTSADDDGQ